MIHERHHPPRIRPAGLALLLALGGCAEAEPEPGASVGDIPIPESRLSSLGPIERESLADLVGLGSAIAADGVETITSPIVAREVAASRIGGLPFHLAAERLGLTGSQLEQAYSRSPEWELTVRHMVRLAGSEASPARRDSARAVAAEVATRAAGGADFAELAARYSEEPGAAERGGLLDPGRRGSWVEPFWDAAIQLEQGEPSGVVETIYGFHVLFFESRRPIPLDEASRTGLLRRIISLSGATEAMEQWAAVSGGLLLDAPSIAAARASIGANGTPSDTLVLAAGAGGERFTGGDLAVAWARLSPDARSGLESVDETTFATWLEEEARAVIWGEVAESMGVEPAPGAEAAASALWSQTLARWAAIFGFRSGLEPDELVAAAAQATLSGTAEVRGARDELRSLRPLIRQLYPFSESAPAASAMP